MEYLTASNIAFGLVLIVAIVLLVETFILSHLHDLLGEILKDQTNRSISVVRQIKLLTFILKNKQTPKAKAHEALDMILKTAREEEEILLDTRSNLPEMFKEK